jgi:glucose/arabinose dehydrogenase
LAYRLAVACAFLGVLDFGAHARAQATLPAGFADELVEEGLSLPVGIAFLPDGRLLFVEQETARIRMIVNDAIAAIDPVATVPQVNTNGGERGLLGIAADPGWPTRPYVYVHSTSTTGSIRISRFLASGDLSFTGDGSITIDAATRFDLINNIPDDVGNHNGGSVRFGPDGMLYVSIGEDGDACAAQDTSALKGKILRLQTSTLPDGPGTATRAQITPPDNPFSATGGLNARLLWAWGLRNPFRIQVDASNGQVFIADVGEETWEEVDQMTAGGRNFGWSRFEASRTNSNCTLRGAPHTPPIYAVNHNDGWNTIMMAASYRAPAGAARPFPPEYEGNLLVADYNAGEMRRLVFNGSSWQVAAPVPNQPNSITWATGLNAASDYAIGPDGSLWYCRQFGGLGDAGEVRRIVNLSPAAVGDDAETGFALGPVRPNPASRVAQVDYHVAYQARVRLAVVDLQGREVAVLVDGIETPGRHTAVWRSNGRPGVYFFRLQSGTTLQTRRFALLD